MSRSSCSTVDSSAMDFQVRGTDTSFTHTDQASDEDAISPFKLLSSGNFQEFEKIIAKDKSLVNTQNRSGHSLLYLSLFLKRRDFFDFLLTVEEIDVDIVNENTYYYNPLMEASEQEDPYYVLELIKKRALLNVSNSAGETALILAIARNNLKIAEILIESGADVDFQNKSGKTALYVASLEKNHEAVALLLYYKADPSIRTHSNETAFECALRLGHKEVQEILFDFVFDDFKVPGRLTSLVDAMITDADLFESILRMTSEVSWDTPQLIFLFENLRNVDFKYLEMFISAFPCVFSALIDSFASPWHHFLKLLRKSNCVCQIEVFKRGFLNFACNFFDALLRNNIIESTHWVNIEFCLVDALIYNVQNSYEVFERSSLFFLSYGAELKITKIQTTFEYFGYTELLKIFLHMDIVDDDLSVSRSLLPALMCDPHLTVKEFLKKPHDFCRVNQVLKFSALPQFKRYCLRKRRNEVLHQQIKNMPDVLSLVELARDASRSYIVDTFKIRNSRQYCTIIDRLVVPKKVKEFLLFWRPLYSHFFRDDNESLRCILFF